MRLVRRILFIGAMILAVTASFNCTSEEVKFDTFVAMIGLDDGCIGRPGNAVFRVLLDGDEVFKSGVMKPGDTPKYLAVPLEDASSLTLIVDDVGDGHGGDWGNWCDARLIDNETGSDLFLSDMKEVVESKWIDTRMDRNIVENPLKMNGKIYAKGLGAISGSRMSYSGWNKLFSMKKARLLEEDRLALKKIRGLSLVGELPDSATLTAGNVEIGRSTGHVKHRFTPGERIELVFETTAGESILKSPALNSLQVSFGKKRSVPLSYLVPESIEHEVPGDIDVSGIDSIILRSRRYFVLSGTGYKVKVVYCNLPSQIHNRPQLLSGPKTKKQKGLHMVGVVGVESPGENPCATAVFSVKLDGKTVYRSGLATADGNPETFIFPIRNVNELSLEVEDAGDGRYQDNITWADVSIVDFSKKRGGLPVSKITDQYLLSSFNPYISESGWKKTMVGSSANGELIKIGDRRYNSGFGVYAPSHIVFKYLREAFAKRSRAIRQIEEVEKLLLKDKDILTAEKHVLKAKDIDDSVIDIYPILGKIEERKGNIQNAIDCWERLIDIGHASRREKRVARNIIDKLYEKGDFISSLRLPVNQPLVLNHRIPVDKCQDVLFTVIVGTLHKAEDGGDVLLPGTFTLKVDEANAGKYCSLLVNSRGLKHVLAIAKTASVTGKPSADYEQFSRPLPSTGDYTYEWKLEKGTWTIFVDYSRSNAFDNTCSFYLVYSLSDDLSANLSEEWEYTLDNSGGADVKCTVSGNTMILIPHTATGLKVTGADSYLSYPLHQYGTKLDSPYNMGKVLVLSPREDKAAVTFRWPEAAYNVPMTKFGGERKDTFYFKSVQGINPVVGEIEISVTLPEDTGEVTLQVPDNIENDSLTYTCKTPWDKSIRIHAKHEKMDTKWLDKKYRAMTVYLPDNSYNRRWIPEYMDMLKRIYDRESFVMGGYEPDDETFVYLTGSAQLSGFGGATWGGKNSETWIGSSGRIGEYHLRHQLGGDGVEAHELKWVFLNGNVKSLPRWLQTGTVIWIEEQGKLAGNLAFPDYWTRTELKKKSRVHLDTFRERGTGYARLENDKFGRLTNEQKRIGDAMCWYICQYLLEEYGENFWPEFWKLQRKSPEAYVDLDPRSRTVKAVNDMVAISKDNGLKKQFEKWGFDLSPDPQYSEQHSYKLPRKWAFKQGDDPAWRASDFKHDDWVKIGVGKPWESAPGNADYDGFAWYRIRFIWPGKLDDNNLVIDLGKIDDSDEVFFNGVKIGHTGTMPPEYTTAWTLPRRYPIPAELVNKDGENVIAVRVYDGAGGGGVYNRVPRILSLIE